MLDSYVSLRQELITRGGKTGAGEAICRQLTAALDRDVARLLPGQGRAALVAVGGYGRGELCLHSDVDLMLLHPGSVPAGAERVFYPLWDAGLKVGHAVRSVREAIQAAREYIETLTALLDARLVAGDLDLFGDLKHAMSELLHRGRLDLSGRLSELERARRQRESFPLQELNVKEGRGGLRALQGIHWDSRGRELAWRTGTPPSGSRLLRREPAGLPGPAPRRFMGAETSDLAERTAHETTLASHPGEALLSASPAAASVRETLLATRNALHAVSGKAFDVYVHDLHHVVAEWLGVESQAWSQRLYQDAHQVDRLVRGHWEQAVSRPSEEPRRWWRPGFLDRRASPDEERAPRPFFSGTVLTLAARATTEAGRPFDAEQEAMIRSAMGPMWTAEDREGFLTLLRAGDRGYEVFDALDALGWAVRALPEWGHVRGLPQYAPFHLHSVDVHLWKTVAETLALARRDSPEPALAGVAAELDSLDDALLAALLHDIGKGWPGDHAVAGARAARAFCRRAQFGPRTAATVARVIEHHLLLPTIATRRDLDDPATIRDVADAVADGRTLRILYLLSVADSRATGPAVWSPWKAALMQRLYEGVDDELRRRERAVPSVRPAFEIAPLLELVGGTVNEGVVRQHLAAMPRSYTDAWTPAELAQHVRLMWPAPVPGEVRLEVTRGDAADDLALALEDRPGLLAITSGVLALNNISVLGGRFVTRSDGVALQSLHVVDALNVGIDEERWGRVQRDIPRVLIGELDLEAALREKMHASRWMIPEHRRRIPTRVVADPRISAHATLVEIHAEDRAGLLHDITRALFDLRLDINLAKVDTLGREVVDVFYVRDLDGHAPSNPADLKRIEAGVMAALEP
ncbi:MAG: HD domain-containing protein [Dehalococcoidia bacterium]